MKVGEKKIIARNSEAGEKMAALGVPVAKKVPRIWEELGLRKYLVLGVCLL